MNVRTKDLATLAELEICLSKTLKAARSAARRLERAGYPGADWVLGELETMLEGPDVNLLLVALCEARIGAGDEGAWAFQHFCVRYDMSVDAGVEEVINNDGSSERTLLRALALRRYAEQLAS